MSKHTPGPWIWDDHNNLIDSKGGYPIASIKLPTRSTYPQSVKTKDKERDANARLIAAAPDLLEVAKLILAEWEAPTEGVEKGTLIARLSQYSIEARAAIQKAEGK